MVQHIWSSALNLDSEPKKIGARNLGNLNFTVSQLYMEQTAVSIFLNIAGSYSESFRDAKNKVTPWVNTALFYFSCADQAMAYAVPFL